MTQPKRKTGDKPSSSGSTKSTSGSGDASKPTSSSTKAHDPSKHEPKPNQTPKVPRTEQDIQQYLNTKYGGCVTATRINGPSDFQRHFEKLAKK